MTVTFHPAAPPEDPTFTYVKSRSSLKPGGGGSSVYTGLRGLNGKPQTEDEAFALNHAAAALSPSCPRPPHLSLNVSTPSRISRSPAGAPLQAALPIGREGTRCRARSCATRTRRTSVSRDSFTAPAKLSAAALTKIHWDPPQLIGPSLEWDMLVVPAAMLAIQLAVYSYKMSQQLPLNSNGQR